MSTPSSTGRKPRFADLIAGFSRHHVLVVGDVMVDRYVFGKVERLNPEAPVPILHAKSEQQATGGAGNTAKNVAGLGARATLVSVVGTDAAAGIIAEAAQRENYEAVLVGDASRPTIQKVRYVVGSQQMLRVDHEEIHSISPAVEAEVIARLTESAKVADSIIVSDYAKGFLTPGIAGRIMALSREHGLPVMADVKPSHIELFKGASYISPNRKEAHEYLGLNQHLHGGHPRDELARRLHEQFQTGVFLTLSEDGMYIFTGDSRGVHVPQVHRVEVADTSGCGDTAAVTILLAKLSGADDVEAATLGNAAGAIIAGKIGAVALSQAELAEIMGR